MIDYNYAKSRITKKHPDSIVAASFDSPSAYIFSLRPKSWSDKDVVLDGLFKVSKANGMISEYSPVSDPEEFKNALRRKIE